MKVKNPDRLGRIFFSVIILILLARCVYFLASGELNYRNYWGGVVFVPIAIVILLLFLLVLWKWDKWKKVRSDKKGRYIDWPGDDWKRW